MGLETGSTIASFITSNPTSSDPVNQGDDHLRLIKSVLQAQFPGSGGLGFSIPITATETQLNNAATLTGTETLTNKTLTSPTLTSPTLTGTTVTPTATSGDNTTKIASTAFVQAALTLAVPPGTLIQWAGATAPTGYLACPTTATNISRSTYSALFTAIGTLWGAGDGSTTFGLPYFATDQVGVQVGAGTVGTNTVGAILAHTHTYSASNALGAALLSGGFDPTNATTNTGSTGGSANLAAGNRVMYCIRY